MNPYTLIRSRRKTIAIHITRDANLEVRAPLKMPVADIERFISSKEKWITKHLTLREHKNSEKSAFALNYGDMVSLCGTVYPILAKTGKCAEFDGECFFIPSDMSPEHIKNAVIQIYKAVAKNILAKKTAAYAERMHVNPTAVRINSARTRWGSCSGKNSLNFSWRLVMADEDVIDYVAVHELAHITEHNHSPRFWAVVESIMPDYRQRKLKLKALQDKLSREDWE